MERRGFLASLLAVAVAPLAAVLPKPKLPQPKWHPGTGVPMTEPFEVIVPHGCWFFVETDFIVYPGIRPSQLRYRFRVLRVSDNSLVQSGERTLSCKQAFCVRWTDAAGTRVTSL